MTQITYQNRLLSTDSIKGKNRSMRKKESREKIIISPYILSFIKICKIA
ncbi:hypothetical protein [Helicobacter japonicus]|nr:hypothetical protein [Helicobacter japonicus]